MRSIKAWTACPRMWSNGMWCARDVGANSALHGMMVVESRRLRNLSCPLTLSRSTIEAALFCGSKNGACSWGIFWIVEEAANIVDEEWIKKLSYLFLVCEIKGPFVRNPKIVLVMLSSCNGLFYLPHAFQMHWPYLDHVTCFLALENAIAATSSHASNVQKFCPIDHMIVCQVEISSLSLPGYFVHVKLTFTACNADAFCFHLKAKTSLIFPERCGYPWLHSWRSNLSSGIKRMLTGIWSSWCTPCAHILVRLRWRTRHHG